jgi:acyl-CoA dehydrogenase
MDFAFTEDQLAIKDSVAKLCAKFDDRYWLKKDKEGGFPDDFYRTMAEAGWLGIAMPEEYGGSGLGITEAALLMQTVAESGAALQGASAIHLNIFGPNPIVVFGTEEQKKRILPDIIKGKVKGCFAVTEPDAGLNTTMLDTKAERDGNGYVVHGKKTFTTTASVADKMLLIARTTPKDKCKKPTDGLSLFYTDLDRSKVEVRRIPKMGRAAVDSNTVFIDDLFVPDEDRIGEEGRGFRYLLDGLNPERILIGIEAVGLGRNAIDRAAIYARERKVFGRFIGQNQGIQHPLAECWALLESAFWMAMRAASLYDSKQPCGAEANATKLLGGRAAFEACTQAVLTFGGMGYAKEYHVERLFRECMFARIAPVTEQLILSFIGEKVLDLPKSY